ncbi:MAG: DUF192 domain-containing protein [Bacteroidetes bacterium]|nr:DUF192 domain-containing protein [Bacteroidota bacterium]
MNHVHRLFYSLLFTFALLACNQSTPDEGESSRSAGRTIEYTATLAISGISGEEVALIDIAIADDDKSRSLGLMDVQEMKSDGGMLFIFESEQRQSFWMANTPLSLDLLFADREGRIVHIHQNAQPFTRDQIDSIYPAKYVLEVNAGYVMRHDIQVGHIITYTR